MVGRKEMGNGSFERVGEGMDFMVGGKEWILWWGGIGG